MSTAWLYWFSLLVLLAAASAAVGLAYRRRSFRTLTTLDLATLALMICLLYVAVVPWQMAFAKVPGLDALIFSIPYTALFLLGLRLVPKPGAATLLIFGQGLFGQILARGINPAWWPYYLMCAVCVELFLMIAGHALQSLWTMMAVGVLRGVVSYAYMYLIVAPFLWHQFYAWWYVALKVSLGMIGCAVGAWLGWRLAPIVEKASRFG